MKSHALLLAFFAFAFSAYSQNVSFQRLFGNSLDNRFNKVIRHADDFYVLGTDEVVDSLTPHATLSKLNFQGQLQWTVRLGVPSIWNDIIVTDEGNLLLVGATMPYDVNAFSLMGVATPNGDFLWVNMYNFADRELLSRAVRHPNPPDPAFPYYVLGITQQPNFASSDDINLLNIDASGNVNWRRLIGDNGDEEFYRDIEILSNGNLLLTGHAGTSAVSVIVNPSGDVVSGNQYSSGTRIYDAIERPGAGFYFAGSSLPASPAQLTRVNPNFQVVWSRTIPQLTFLSRVWIGGPDQALYVLGFGNINGAGRYVVIKITETANVPAIQWVKYLDGGESAYASGNLFFLPPDQIAYVDGRTDHPIGFGQSDAFLSVSELDLETCITQLGPTLSLSSFAMASTAYSTPSAPASVPTPADMPKQGVAWQQIAICGSSCEPVNSPTFSAVLAPQTPTIEIALDAFQASNGEHVSLGLSTGFSQFSLDLIFVRMDDQGALIGEPKQLDFFSNGDELEMLVDSETQSNAHLAEVFDSFGASQGYLLTATMFNSVFSPSGPPTPDILVALIDHEGCVLWSRFLERPNADEYARGALQLPGGDLLVLVERVVAGAGVMQMLRFPINGQDCNEFTYELPTGDSFFPSSIARVQDLNNPQAAIAVAGSYRKAGLRYVGISILRSDLSIVGPGPLLFDMLPTNTDDIPTPNGIVQKGQNLALAGVLRKNSIDREGFLMELSPFLPNGDVDGAVIWARRIRLSASNGEFPNGYRIYALDVNPAGELFAGGGAFLSSETSHAFLLKTNSQGMVQKINMFTGEFGDQEADNARVFDLRVAPDGSAVVAGYRPRPSLSDGFFWIARTDPNGNLHDCDCFDPLPLQIENYQPVFSQSTSQAPTESACNSIFTIPECNPFQTEVAYCDQFSPLPPCLAGFTWEIDNDCGEVQFINQSIGAIPEYLWQFGDPFNSASTEINPSFAYLSSGTYTICLTVTTADCTDTYCEEVTVTLAGAPATLVCPPNVVIEADPGACENTTFQLPEADVTDNCPCDTILDVDYPPGYFGPYPAGTSTFTVAAVDACGFVTCQVSVTVDDGLTPAISCPPDITLPLGASTDPSVTGEPLVDDPCGDATLTFTDFLIDSGPCFSFTERTWIATDPNGNADTCKHIITLLDLTPPLISCPDIITVESCQAVFDNFDIEVETNCSGPEDWQLSYALTGATTGAGAGLPTGIPFQPGTTQVEITVETLPGVSANCNFEVVVIDITAGFTAEPLSDCEDAWQFTPAVQDAAYTYLWNFGDGNSSSEIAPQHAYNQSGNFMASLLLTTPGGCEASMQALVAVQLQLEGSVSSATNCKTVELAGAPTGPGLTWTWETPAGTFIGDSVSVEFPEYGVFEVCATLSDGLCTQVVCTAIVLEDLQAPVMTCADVELTAEPGLCTAPFTPTVPAATDNCGAVTVGGTRSDGLPLDAPWPGGETCITWTAADEAGNTSVCLQCITVIDEELPTIACPDDLVVEADLGATTAVVVFDSPTASDNCGLDTVFCSPASGAELPIGVHPTLCTAIDDFGNEAECNFLITVLPSSDTCCVDSMAFLANVNAGFSWSLIGGCEYEFAPNQLNGCQQVIEWTWGDGTTAPGPGAVTHFFPGDGDFTVCMLVAEFDEATGEICWEETYCETISIACADICELNLLPLRTGYDYENQEPLSADGAWDPYWSPGMITAPTVGGLPPLPGSNWIVPEEGPGYYLRRVEFNFCLPAGSFDCEDLLFDLDMQAWALAAIRINGRPADGNNLFQNPAYGATGTWTFQPSAADCGLFREGGNTLTLDVKTVYPAGGLNISGSLSTLSGEASLGAPGCCAPPPPCDCADFVFDNIGVIPSDLAEANPCRRAFRPEGVDDCDEVEWYLNAELIASGTGADWVYMELPNGAGEVCLRVTRTDPDGNFCGVIEKCWDFIVDCSAPEICENSVVENPGFEGTQGLLGQDGEAAPWAPAFGNPWIAEGPGATDANYLVLSGNDSQGDAVYQELSITPLQIYQLSLSALRYLPARAGENARVVVRIADQPQTSFTCVGNCQTLANITELSDSEWYRYIISWQAFSANLKYLHVFVRNSFTGADPEDRSYIQIDNVCLDIISSVGEQPLGQALSIFPNPTGGELTLQPARPFSEEARLTVFDLWGRPVLSQDLQAGAASYPLSLAALPPAVYWLEVNDGNGNIVRERVVKL